ncbi:MAG: 50S ribosomal protein L5 [Patescibacteria group bacterium]
MWQSIQQKFTEKIIPRRAELFGVKNTMATPRLTKVVLNARIKRGGKADEEVVVNTLEKITGQKAVITKAKKSISNFKIREGQAVGVKVTLRGARLNHFLDKFINVVLPRVRDFSGLSPAALDNAGNATFGITEHLVFPEVGSDDMSKTHGLQICISTTAKNNKDALTLLKELGFPFKASLEKKEKKKKIKKYKSKDK